jgi:hypothetical protein
MGKVVNIVLVIIMVGGAYFMLSSGDLIYFGTEYDDMSASELSDIAIDWNYRDLQRNYDENNGKVIFVQGVISNVQSNQNTVTICEKSDTSKFSCNVMFVRTDSNWLVDDKISGFVEITGIREVANPVDPTGIIGKGTYYPSVNDIRLFCTTC